MHIETISEKMAITVSLGKGKNTVKTTSKHLTEGG